MRRGGFTGVVCILLLALSACGQTEFLDEFEDGIVNPAYRFAVGDASSLLEGVPCGDWGACLQRQGNAYFFLPYIPGDPQWVVTPVRPGALIELDVLALGPACTVEVGAVDDMENPLDYFALKVEIDASTGNSLLTCYDEAERVPVDGSLAFPLRMSFTVDEAGRARGAFADGTSRTECTLDSGIASDTLFPAVVLWSSQEAGLAWVDDFHVKVE